MIEKRIDLWQAAHGAEAVCITTNGTVTGRGLGVMGRGCALEAAERYNPGKKRYQTLQRRLGDHLRMHGNHVGILVPPPPWTLVAFPVKHEWQEMADFELIYRSCKELIALADRHGWTQVVLPRPGCGNGGLSWVVVQPIGLILDDRFIVVTK